LSLKTLAKKIEFAKSQGDKKGSEELGQLYLDTLQGLADDALSRGRSSESQAYLTEKARFEKEGSEPNAADFRSMAEYIKAVEAFHGLRRPAPSPEERRRDAWRKLDSEMTLKFGDSWTEDTTRKATKKEIEK
jgi:hypothetical protein